MQDFNLLFSEEFLPPTTSFTSYNKLPKSAFIRIYERTNLFSNENPPSHPSNSFKAVVNKNFVIIV